MTVKREKAFRNAIASTRMEGLSAHGKRTPPAASRPRRTPVLQAMR